MTDSKRVTPDDLARLAAIGEDGARIDDEHAAIRRGLGLAPQPDSGGRRHGDPDERQQLLPHRCADHSDLCADLAAAEAVAREDHLERGEIRADLRKMLERIHSIELKGAALVSAAAFIGASLPRLIDAIIPAAHAAISAITGVGP
jgi:hypothetical protein